MELTETLEPAQVALIADATNKEVHRLNARVQYLRGERGELGEREVELADVDYGLREGDLVAFIRQHRMRGEPKVDNGSRGEITRVSDNGAVTVTLEGSGREVELTGEDVNAVWLGYAQHINRQQGATVERAVVVTGGWQTSKESSYVEASRVKEGTDWYLAREDLGTEGTDIDRIERLASKMSQSRAQTPSVEYESLEDIGMQLDPALQLRELGIETVQTEMDKERDLAQEHDLEVTR